MKFEDPSNYGPVLRCPSCNNEFTHLTKVETGQGDENRLAVTLYFDCENGHTFSHYLYNHEGYTISETDSKDGGQWG